MKGQPRSGKAEDRRYFKEVRFRQIRALFEISRQGSFAAAARSLGMATPSVWRQVRALEDDYGVRFVTAKGRAAIVLTGGVLQVVVEAEMRDEVGVGGRRGQ
jgi:molybdate transport repressor ModE-like protein